MSNSELVMNQAKSAIENSISDALERFQNDRFGTVRVVMRNDDPWFVAKDIASCIEHKDVTSMCRMCREKDLFIDSASKFNSADLAESGNSRITLISESGLYRILAKCNLPKCEPFESWVFDEVLPSIRKKGSYQVSQSKLYSYQIEDPIKRAEAWIEEQKAAKKALEAEKEQHEADNRDFREGLDILESKCAQIAFRQSKTAMDTAARKARENIRLTNENETLKEKLGDSANLKAVKSLPWLKEFFRFIDKSKWNALLSVVGREIGKICESNGFRKIRIDDPNWGEVWAYDIKAVEIFKGKLIQDLNYLRKYRIYQDA